MTEAADHHNKMAPDLLKQIVRTTSTPSAALVIVESIVMGAALYAAGGDPRKAAEYVEHMTQAVLERLAALHAHATGEPWESPFGQGGSFAAIYRAMAAVAPKPTPVPADVASEAVKQILEALAAGELIDGSTPARVARFSQAHIRTLLSDYKARGEEIERLNTRLENNFVFNEAGERISVPAGSIPDGIECRDETIKLLHESREAQALRIKALEAGLDRLQRLLFFGPDTELGDDMRRIAAALTAKEDTDHA